MSAEHFDGETSHFIVDPDAHEFTRRQRHEIERQLSGTWKKVRRNAPAHARLFDLLVADLAARSRTSEGRSVFNAINLEFFDSTSFDLASFANELSTGPQGERCTPLFFQALYARCSDPLVIQLALVAHRRAFERIVHFIDPSGRNEDAVAELFAQATAMMVAGQWSENFLAELTVATRRQVRHQSRHASHEIELSENVDVVTAEANGTLFSDDLLASWVICGIISEFDAEVINCTRVHGESLRDLANELCVPYKTLQSQRLRAERAVAGYLRRKEPA
jgi:hypothetical protein